MTIEELNIEIAADSEAANSGLKKLTATLEKFKKALPDGSKMNKARDALKALAEAFGTYNNVTQNVAANNKEINKSVKELTDSTKKLTDATQKNNKSDNKSQSVRKKIKEIKDDIQKAWNTLGGFFNESNRYIESLNLFEVTMGNSAKSALDFAENVSDAMGIDVSEWIEYQGTFQQLSTGFGVASDAASVMSQNLTQLSYDLASFFNVDTETAAGKLSSAMAGQIKGLREFGIDTSVAALQQYALENNITKTVSSMTQAEKTFLRYNLILEKSVNIQGDMARTLITPANSIRILNSQIVQLKRQLGNIVSVFAVKLIPIIQAVVRVAAEAAEKIAKLLGFELPKIDYSGLDTNGFTDDIEDAENGLDNATASAKEFRKQLMGFDELNIINENKQTSTSGGSIKNESLDFGVDDLKSYDFLKDMTKETDKWYDSIKKVADIVVEVAKQIWSAKTAIGVIIGLVALSKVVKWGKGVIDNFTKIIKTIKGLQGATNTTKSSIGALGTVATVAAATIGTAFIGRDFFKSIKDGTLTVTEGFMNILTAVGLLGVAFAVGGPIGLAIAGVGLLAGAFVGLAESLYESREASINADENYQIILQNLSNIEEAAEQSRERISEMNEMLSEYEKIGQDAEYARSLVDQIFELSENAEKGRAKTEELNGLITSLNELGLENVQLEYDDLNDMIIDTKTNQKAVKDEIYETIEAIQKQAETVALTNGVTKAQELLYEQENAIKEKTDEWMESQIALSKAKGDFNEMQIWADNDQLDRQQKIISRAEKAVSETEAALDQMGRDYLDLAEDYDFYNTKLLRSKGLLSENESSTAQYKKTLEQLTYLPYTFKIQTETTYDNNTKTIMDMVANSKSIDVSFPISVSSSSKVKEFTFNSQTGKFVKGYATGGFPSAGQMFYAREDGVPEMVGRIGNRTAVANNDQITAAIANAVYNAMIASGGGKSSSQTNVTLELDGDVVARKVISYNNRQVAQTGASPLLV